MVMGEDISKRWFNYRFGVERMPRIQKKMGSHWRDFMGRYIPTVEWTRRNNT